MKMLWENGNTGVCYRDNVVGIANGFCIDRGCGRRRSPDPQHDVVLRVDDSLRASCYCSVLISALWSGVWLFPACDYNCITRADLPGILTEEASIEWECHRRSIYRMSLTAMIVIVFLKSTLHNHQHAYVKATLIEQMTNTCISNLIN